MSRGNLNCRVFVNMVRVWHGDGYDVVEAVSGGGIPCVLDARPGSVQRT